MDDLPIDYLMNSEPAFYLDWQGVIVGLVIAGLIGLGIYLDNVKHL